jgi:hypothetical protein
MAGNDKFTPVKSDFNAASSELLVVRATDEHSIELMRRAYHEIYEPAFPIEDERDPLDKIESRLRNPVNGVKRVILLAGRGLKEEQADKAELAAIGIAYYYSSTGAGLLAYNAVSPKLQGGGFGKMMVQGRIKGLQELAAEGGQELQSVIIEVNNPAKVRPEDDSMDPAKRIALFEKWGAKLIPVDYVQPPLGPGLEKSRNSLLMAYPLNGRYPDGDQVAAFVTGIWQAHKEFAGDFENDPDYKATIQELKKWGGFKDLDAPAPAAPPAAKPPAPPK